MAATTAVLLHAAPLLLLLRPAAPMVAPFDPPAIVVELIRAESSPPDQPSDRAVGKPAVQSAHSPLEHRKVERLDPKVQAEDALVVPPQALRPAASSTPRPSVAETTTAPPASPAPATSQTSSAPQEWRARVLSHLNRHKRYPAIAERRRQEGMVYLRFTMDRSGRVLSASIERRSGFPMLDNEALAMLSRAQPLPPPPPEETGSVIEISTYVDFYQDR